VKSCPFIVKLPQDDYSEHAIVGCKCFCAGIFCNCFHVFLLSMLEYSEYDVNVSVHSSFRETCEYSLHVPFSWAAANCYFVPGNYVDTLIIIDIDKDNSNPKMCASTLQRYTQT
jgi:hypothetical protein